MVSASAPLLQCWFALTPHPRARDPYFLYAASNAGSLLALLAYPIWIEPNLGLSVQTRTWRAGYLLLAILILICGVAARRLSGLRANRVRTDDPEANIDAESGRDAGDTKAAMTLSLRLRWLVLVFIPSSWLMGVTTYLTTDLAAIPLFWTIPLALYLLSFILAFAESGQSVVRAATRLLPFVIMPLVLVMSAGFPHAIWIPLHLLGFVIGSLACHGALAKSRPAARHATTFYLTVATGGLLGGVFTAIVAPIIFNRVVEYPLALVLACLVAPGSNAGLQERSRAERWKDLVFPGVVFLLTAILATNQAGLADSLLGVLAIMVASGLGILVCLTANRRPIRFALHGWGCFGGKQFLKRCQRSTAACRAQLLRRPADHVRPREQRASAVPRHHASRPAEPRPGIEPRAVDVLHTLRADRASLRGSRPHLGSTRRTRRDRWAGGGYHGLLCAPGQTWIFYEIDPAVSRIARDPRYFTYLRDCDQATIEIVEGDARLQLQEAPDHAYRIIMLDAFSSDSVPVHLISRQAIQLYMSKIAKGGVLAFNLSNRYLDLEPVIGQQAADAGLNCLISYDVSVSAEEEHTGKQKSIWAVATVAEHDLGGLISDSRWRRPRLRPGAWVWTDDYSDLVSYIHWLPRPLGRREP